MKLALLSMLWWTFGIYGFQIGHDSIFADTGAAAVVVDPFALWVLMELITIFSVDSKLVTNSKLTLFFLV